jgi:hypothetical protein
MPNQAQLATSRSAGNVGFSRRHLFQQVDMNPTPRVAQKERDNPDESSRSQDVLHRACNSVNRRESVKCRVG